MAKKDYQKGALSFGFVPLPKDVLKSDEFAGMSTAAIKLMLDLAVKYTGKNNGQLDASFEAMKRCGWTSKHTLLRAKDSMLKMSFALCTRKGHPPRTSEWIGFTWWKLDWHKSMEVDPRHWPYLNFTQPAELKPGKPTRESLYERWKTNAVVPKQHHEPAESAPGSAETAPRDTPTEAIVVPKQHHATEVNAENGRGAETAPVLELTISGDAAGAPLLPSGVGLHGVQDTRPRRGKARGAGYSTSDGQP